MPPSLSFLFFLTLGQIHSLSIPTTGNSKNLRIPVSSLGDEIDRKIHDHRNVGMNDQNYESSNRRYLFSRCMASVSLVLLPKFAWSDEGSSSFSSPLDMMDKIKVTLSSPTGSSLGIGLKEGMIDSESRLIVQSVSAGNQATQFVQKGMILDDHASLSALQKVLKEGPYPVTLTFTNTPAQTNQLLGSPEPVYKIIVTKPGSSSLSGIKSRRDDILEIRYTAQYGRPGDNDEMKRIIYDASEFRGTGLPYFMVLGSGDMLPGVDQGLVNMQPGEERRLVIPPPLGYGRKGNKFFGVPPDATLIWDVELVSVNGEK